VVKAFTLLYFYFILLLSNRPQSISSGDARKFLKMPPKSDIDIHRKLDHVTSMIQRMEARYARLTATLEEIRTCSPSRYAEFGATAAVTPPKDANTPTRSERRRAAQAAQLLKEEKDREQAQQARKTQPALSPVEEPPRPTAPAQTVPKQTPQKEVTIDVEKVWVRKGITPCAAGGLTIATNSAYRKKGPTPAEVEKIIAANFRDGWFLSGGSDSPTWLDHDVIEAVGSFEDVIDADQPEFVAELGEAHKAGRPIHYMVLGKAMTKLIHETVASGVSSFSVHPPFLFIGMPSAECLRSMGPNATWFAVILVAGHYYLVCKIRQTENVVFVMDGLNSTTPKCVSDFCQRRGFVLQSLRFERQQGSNECAVWALAATSALLDQSPVNGLVPVPSAWTPTRGWLGYMASGSWSPPPPQLAQGRTQHKDGRQPRPKPKPGAKGSPAQHQAQKKDSFQCLRNCPTAEEPKGNKLMARVFLPEEKAEVKDVLQMAFKRPTCWTRQHKDRLARHTEQILGHLREMRPRRKLVEALIEACGSESTSPQLTYSRMVSIETVLRAPELSGLSQKLDLRDVYSWRAELRQRKARALEWSSHRDRPALSVTQVNAMAQQGPLNVRALVVLLWSTASRVQQMLHLHKRDVQLDMDGTVRCTFGRHKTQAATGGSPLTVQGHVGPHLALIRHWLEVSQDGPLWPVSEHVRLQKAVKQSALRQGDTADLRGFRRGSLRRLAASGAPEETLRKISGHKTRDSLLRYLDFGACMRDLEVVTASRAMW
jgi:hypothetical protein